MYKNKTVSVVIPAFNEELHLERVVKSIPEYVDRILIVDDASIDNTNAVAKQLCRDNDKVELVRHTSNQGCGAALATGFRWARDNDFDIAVRMDGDGQMNPGDLEALLTPVADGLADYSKGNRLFTGEAYKIIPKVRYFGNAFLSLLTKIASGYWHIADFQSGYTAINKKALLSINWDAMYKDYGQPNDLLVRLNVHNFRVVDVPVEPIYNIGEHSGIKIQKVIFTISWLLFKLFLWRMKEKYIIRDFHPLIFFYLLGGLFGLSTLLLFIRIVYFRVLMGFFPPTSSLATFFAFMSASLFTLFAMWFDMEANKDLK
jgi:glycosyltransferase involved in cell wall biosynthesis